MAKRVILKAAAFTGAVTLTLYACGAFDYSATEFSSLQDSGKNFQSINQEEIDGIIQNILENDPKAISTKTIAADLQTVADNVVPKGATNLFLANSGYQLADTEDLSNLSCLGDISAKELDSYMKQFFNSKDPCDNNTDVIACRSKQVPFYLHRTACMLKVFARQLKDANMGAALFGIKYDENDADPSGIKTGQLSKKIEALLPTQLKSAKINYRLTAVNTTTKEFARNAFMVLFSKLKLAPDTYQPVSFLNAMYSGTENEAPAPYKTLATFTEAPAKYTTPDFNRFYMSIDGSAAKIPNATKDKTVGNLWLSYKDTNNFWLKVDITSIACKTTYQTVPYNTSVVIYVGDDVTNDKSEVTGYDKLWLWRGKIMTYVPHFASTTCDPASDPTAQTGLKETTFYTDMIANKEKMLASFYTMDPALDTIPSSQYLLLNHCSNYPSHCSAGKVGTESALLSSFGNHACYSSVSDKANIEWLSTTTVGKGVCMASSNDSTNPSFLSLTTDLYTTSDLWKTPKYLKNSLSTTTVPNDLTSASVTK